jgi:hypothetical protein
MDDPERRASQILEAYEARGRPLLQSLGARELPQIDAAAEVLRLALAQQRALRVGFLGESQVGKSSIINALVGQRVLPSGGVGPLTAQETTIAHASAPAVRVKYHGRARLNAFRLALERYVGSLGELPPGTEAPPEGAEGEAGAYGILDFRRPEEGSGEDASGAQDERRKVGEYLLSQARLMLGVAPEVPRSEVLDLVRALVARDEPKVPAAMRERVLELRRRVEGTEEFSRASLGAREFNQALRLRAAGWLSPLVAELHVTLDMQLLEAMELVDLPGVGVVGDPAGRVAEEFVRTRADALVIVMRNNGLTEQVARLLESTGVITKLLFGAQSALPPIHVAVVVTYLDNVARERWTAKVVEARESGEKIPARGAVFRELAAEMSAKVRHQIGEALLSSRDFEDLTAEQRAKREGVVRALCEAMTVVCVAAPDYINIIEGIEDVGFLKDKADTHVPLLSDELAGLSDRSQKARRARLKSALEEFDGLQARTLQSHERSRADGGAARAEAAGQFREALDAAADPLRAEAKKARQVFLKFLEETMRERLDGLSGQAADRATKRLLRLKAEGTHMAWSTLNAALVRNGAFRGSRHIDYPGDLTRAFVDMIAGSWESTVIAEVRKAFDQLCETDRALVDRFNAAAARILSTGDPDATLRELSKLRRDLGKTSIAWTQAQLDELSEDVRTKLAVVVGKPIERACLNAKYAGRNRGRGARDRILEVFDAGGRDAIEQARAACAQVLDDHLQRLRRSLAHVLRDDQDPVTAVFEQIVDTQAEAVARLGEERRREQLAAIQAYLSGALPAEQAKAAPAAPSAAPTPGTPAANVRDLGANLFDDL